MYSTLFRKEAYLGASSFFIRQKKWPTSFSGINAIPSDDSDFTVSMGLKPFSEKIPETGIDLSKKEYSLHAQNTTYTGVIRTTINETGASAQWPLPTLKYVYFVQGKGIMGFDDLDGHTWRRK